MSEHASVEYYLDPDLYDIVYADYVADIEAHVALMRGAGGPALEVACGNGRLLVPTLAAGIPCDGLDADDQMLASLGDKLAAKRLSASVVQADMRDFSLPGRYALIAIPFNSFLHNLTQADQLATLRCCRRHLRLGGRLALTAFHPSVEKLLRWNGAEQLFKDTPLGDGRLQIWDSGVDDRVEQTRRMTRRIEISDAGGQVTRREVVQFSLRYIYKPEMELLLQVAGFARWEARPLFAEYRNPASIAGSRPIQEGDIVLWTAWKD